MPCVAVHLPGKGHWGISIGAKLRPHLQPPRHFHSHLQRVTVILETGDGVHRAEGHPGLDLKVRDTSRPKSLPEATFTEPRFSMWPWTPVLHTQGSKVPFSFG